MLIYVTILIILMLFQNRPTGDQRGPCGRPGAREHRVGDPWCRVCTWVYCTWYVWRALPSK